MNSRERDRLAAELVAETIRRSIDPNAAYWDTDPGYRVQFLAPVGDEDDEMSWVHLDVASEEA